jgi:hypothetical protein
VELDRALGHDQRPRDVGVRLAAHHVLEHVDLAPRQQVAQARVALRALGDVGARSGGRA